MLRIYNSAVQLNIVGIVRIVSIYQFGLVVSLHSWFSYYVKYCVLSNYAPHYKLDQHNYHPLTPHNGDIIIPTKEQEGCNSPVTDFWKGDISNIYDWFWTDIKLPGGREVLRFSVGWHVWKVAWIFGKLLDYKCGFTCWYIFNRIGVARAVLQTPLWLTD